MALRKRNKVNAGFSMSSMTDIVFLLLIFFMVTSTLISPNALKLLLPQSNNQTNAKPLTTISITKDIDYYVNERGKLIQVSFSEIEPFLQETLGTNPVQPVYNLVVNNFFTGLPEHNTGKKRPEDVGQRHRMMIDECASLDALLKYFGNRPDGFLGKGFNFRHEFGRKVFQRFTGLQMKHIDDNERVEFIDVIHGVHQ